jgi:hypothetical protein
MQNVQWLNSSNEVEDFYREIATRNAFDLLVRDEYRSHLTKEQRDKLSFLLHVDTCEAILNIGETHNASQ